MERFLAGVEPFKRLSAADRQRLAAVSREKHYAKGETIFRAGQPAEAVYIVKEGRVHLMKFLEGGQVSPPSTSFSRAARCSSKTPSVCFATGCGTSSIRAA